MNKKIAFVVDSSCGYTKEEAEKKGIFFLPLVLTIDGKDYLDGEDMNLAKYYETVNLESDVKTSLTPPGLVEERISKLSKEYDHVLIYPISSGLSGQYNSLKLVTKEFSNVEVINSKSVGSAIASDMEILMKFAKTTQSFDEIIEKANQLTEGIWGLLLPKTMDWLVKGGRISGAAAAMAKLLNIVPMIGININDDGKLDKYSKGRKFEKTLLKACDIVTRKFKNDDSYQFTIYHANASEYIKNINFDSFGTFNISELPPIVVNHTGPGSIGIIAHKKK